MEVKNFLKHSRYRFCTSTIYMKFRQIASCNKFLLIIVKRYTQYNFLIVNPSIECLRRSKTKSHKLRIHHNTVTLLHIEKIRNLLCIDINLLKLVLTVCVFQLAIRNLIFSL